MISRDSSLLDYHFARFLGQRSGLSQAARERFEQLVGALSAALDAGHACLPVGQDDARFLMDLPLVSDGGPTPLIVCNSRLYLHRYYHYEKRLAMQIGRRAAQKLVASVSKETIDLYFAGGEEPDRQREAATAVIKNALTIICGGPGTGKTTTVVKILLLLQHLEKRQLDIALAAPTGKAAMRLGESIASGLQRIAAPAGLVETLPAQATTLHRLLGYRRFSPQFRHNHQNQLPHDLVVVDEASMVDLAMMSKLVDAIKDGGRLVLLGDKDQLASVESGAVLADLIKSLPQNTIELTKTWRFDENIKELAASINRGDSDGALSLFLDSRIANITLPGTHWIEYICRRYALYMQLVYQNPRPDMAALFAARNSFQVLCAMHYGERGVEGINRRVEQSLVRRGFFCPSDSWYPGRPVLITRNEYNLDLFNGDIGICLPDSADGSMKVWFVGTDGTLKSYSPFRLPPCETVFAMTVHKSQGSEFDEVVVVLPEEDNRILSRELLYTAVTRTKNRVGLVGTSLVFARALSRNIERCSGLAELLTAQGTRTADNAGG